MSESLLAIRTMEAEEIQHLLDRARVHRKTVESGAIPKPQPKSVGLLFFENSTRTRVSFEQAAHNLGLRVVNFSGSGSSMSKGESLKDTILTLKHEHLDMVVMRHKSSGAPHLAASYFGGPVINAGDGWHEHPTQALADALTIHDRLGRIEGLTVAIVGDVLHSRVARSNCWLLSKLGAKVRFVGPRTLLPVMPNLFPVETHYDLKSGVADADVVICLRLQQERMIGNHLSSQKEYTRLYQVNRSILRAAKPEAIVMHPGPMNRGVEIDDAVADGPQSTVLEQVTNGIFVRMAALERAAGVMK